MGIIPKDLKTEILKEKDLIDKGFRGLETWCRRRVLVLQNEHLAELAKKSLSSQATRKLNSLKPDADVDETNDEDEAPSWVKHLTAAVKPPPRPASGARPAKPDRGRSPSRSGKTSRDGSRHRNSHRSPSPGRAKLTDWGQHVLLVWV